MSNGQIYRKTFVFSWIRFLIDLIGVLALVGCIIAGYFIDGKRHYIGVLVGLVIGIVIFIVIISFVSYMYKAAQIAMMMRGVTENKLPEHLVSAGKQEVKEHFSTIFVYFTVTGAIKGIFNEISAGINALGNVAGGTTGGEVADTVTSIANTIIAYLCDCCLGWVFYRKGVSAWKSTCEGAVLFFKNWKTLLKNLGRIFGIGILSFIIIGGIFGVGYYFLFKQLPDFTNYIITALKHSSSNLKNITDPTVATMVVAGLFAIITWSILHAAFVRPFVLVGVLRNYMEAGIKATPTEDDMKELDGKFKKFNKIHAKA